MSGLTRPVGISQRTRLEWLDEAAALARAKHSWTQVRSALVEMLRDKVSVSGTAVRGNREKTVTILARIWCRTPSSLTPLRDSGLRLLEGATPASRLAVHWGMTMAVYPFWSIVATHVGRLFRLQGTVTAVQISRRVQERHGERTTVARATRRIVRSFVDWGVLADTETRGRYVPGEVHPLTSPELLAWLAEAVLHARDTETAQSEDLLQQPNLFPFRVSYVPPNVLAAASPRLEVVRHGLDSALLVLRTCS